jgi:hypothetical protein
MGSNKRKRDNAKDDELTKTAHGETFEHASATLSNFSRSQSKRAASSKTLIPYEQILQSLKDNILDEKISTSRFRGCSFLQALSVMVRPKPTIGRASMLSILGE